MARNNGCAECAPYRDPMEPEGYLAWHEWADKKSKTHRSLKCRGCGLYTISVPKGEKHPQYPHLHRPPNTTDLTAGGE